MGLKDHQEQERELELQRKSKDYNLMASTSRKSLLRRLSTAKASGVGNSIRDGKYRLAVKKMSLEEGFKGDRFQATFTVVNSAKIKVISPANPGGNPPKLVETVLDVDPSPVGSDVDYLQMLDDPESPGPGNIRRLFMDLFNRRELSDDEYLETLAEMCDLDAEGIALDKPLNLAKGMVIDGETHRIVTKKNKVEIVVIKWTHVEQTTEEQEAMAKWIDDLAVHAAATSATQAEASA